MKRTVAAISLTFVVAISYSQGVTKETRLEIASANEWRGTVLTDGLVFQPQMDFTFPTGTKLRVWGSFDLEDKGINELQFFARHSFNAVALNGSVGFVHYQRESGFSDTTELFGSVSLTIPLPLTVSIWKDIDKIDGLYVRFGTGAKLPLVSVPGTKTAVSWNTWVGYSDENHSAAYYSSTAAGIADLGGRVTAEFGVGPAWFSPWIQYTTLVDPGFDSLNGHRSNVTYGVAFKLPF